MAFLCTVLLFVFCWVSPSEASYYDSAYDYQIRDSRPAGYHYDNIQYTFNQGLTFGANKGLQQFDYYYQDQERNAAKSGYGYVPPPKKPKTRYVPVVVKKKEKKQKIISISKGFFIAGGTQIFGKFKSLKKCMKACGATPTCFAGDYDPWSGRCFFHSNTTACENMKSHKKITHFRKVPCSVTDAPRGLVVLGANLFGGIEQKGIKSLSDCLKKCANAGGGIADSATALSTVDLFDHNQLCFGIDYDFGTHKCYFHTVLFTRPSQSLPLCPTASDDPVLRPVDLQQNPSTIHILLCPA